MAEIMEGLRLIPPVTRHFMLAAAAVTLPALLALVDLRRFGFYWPFVAKDFEVRSFVPSRPLALELTIWLRLSAPYSPAQLWRLATAFLYAGKGLPLLFDAFLFHRTSAGLETDTYLLDSARYGWSLLWIAGFIQVRLPRTQLLANLACRLTAGPVPLSPVQVENVLYFHAWFLFRPLVRLRGNPSPFSRLPFDQPISPDDRSRPSLGAPQRERQRLALWPRLGSGHL
jgi:hypothetical protein